MEEMYEIRLPDNLPVKAEEEEPSLTMEAAELAAAKNYDPSNRAISAVLNDKNTASSLTQDWIETNAEAPQSDKDKTLTIITMIRSLVNRNDILGAVAEAIENNVNASYRLTWNNMRNRKIAKSEREKAQKVVEEFLEKIELPILIRKAVSSAYVDGTYIMDLKSQGKAKDDALIPEYTVDTYPIGVAQISDYTIGYNDPVVLVDMNDLKSKLRKTYTKDRKNKALFYENEEKEIKATFPPEVVKAYAGKERYAKLDVGYTGVIRLNNQGLPYGLSPLFRSLEAISMLDTLSRADRLTAKARSKKVLAQFLNKEILGPTFDRDTYKAQAYAHNTLLSAWQNAVVLVTAPATVREIKYIEPTAELTNVDTINYYRNRVMSTLGVSFLNINGTSSMTASNISVKQLMREINKISQQLETILEKWFKVVLRDAGLDPSVAPKISVVDSEEMEESMRMELADFLLNKMNASYESAFDILGLSAVDEKERRIAENEEGLDKVFFPRATAYTATPGNEGDEGGRPADKESKDADKQAMDKENNKIKER